MKYSLLILFFVLLVSCERTGQKKMDISKSEKNNLILIETLYNSDQIKNLITDNKIEFSKIQDFEDNCYVYHYSNDFFSEQNQFRGAITSDTYEYYSKEKEDIQRFFNDSLNINRGFETFKYKLTDDFKLNSEYYAVHEIYDGDKFTGYEIAIVINNKIIRSSIVFLSPIKLDFKLINDMIERIKTMPNNV